MEKIKNHFSIYPIGVGDNINENFMTKISNIFKVVCTLCKDKSSLNKNIARLINNLCGNDFIYDIKITWTLDEINLYNINPTIEISTKNNIYNFYYLTTQQGKKENNFEIKYLHKGKEHTQKYKTKELIELPPGDELLKLILNKFVL